MKDMIIKIGREHVSMDLLALGGVNFQEVYRVLDSGLAFCGMDGDKCVTICVANRRGDTFDIVSWVVDPEYRGKGYGRTLLCYAFDYLKALGGNAADMSGSNADVNTFTAIQRLGFRVIGVLRNYYKNDDIRMEGGIKRQDLLRYRFSL